MATRKAPMMTRQGSSGTVEGMAAEAGAAPKVLHGVSKLRGGRLKMVGVKHDARVGMVVPREIADALTAEAKAQGVSKTDLFEDVMLGYLHRRGWKFED